MVFWRTPSCSATSPASRPREPALTSNRKTSSLVSWARADSATRVVFLSIYQEYTIYGCEQCFCSNKFSLAQRIERIGESENREQAMNGFRYYFGTRLSLLVHKCAIFMVCSSLTGLCQSYKPKQINGSGYSAAW